MTEASFPQKELDTIIQSSKQSLKINLEKNDFIAQNTFKEFLLGANNPYGYFAKENDFEQIESKALSDFYRAYIHSNNATLIVSEK